MDPIAPLGFQNPKPMVMEEKNLFKRIIQKFYKIEGSGFSTKGCFFNFSFFSFLLFCLYFGMYRSTRPLPTSNANLWDYIIYLSSQAKSLHNCIVLLKSIGCSTYVVNNLQKFYKRRQSMCAVFEEI